MNKKIWPEVEYRAADRFIRRQVAHYGHHLDEEESLGEAWRAYLEADNTYSKVEGCCSFPTYAAYCIEECLEQMRQKRNAHISLESRLSLDHNLEENDETFGQRFFRAQGDFTNAVALWDYMQRQGEEKFRVLRQMNLLYTDGEIMKSNGLDPRSYYQMLKDLQEAFREWQDI